MDAENNNQSENTDGFTIEQLMDIWRLEGNKKDSELLNLLIVSLISSDTLLTKQDCLKSKNEIMKMKEALEKVPSVREDRRAFYNKLFMDSIEICDRDFNELPE